MKKIIAGVLFTVLCISTQAQTATTPTASAATTSAQPILNDQLKFSLNNDGSHYIKATFVNQAWIRYTNVNPGSAVDGRAVENLFDIGLRRTRAQLFGQLTDHVFFYTQFGMNNFSYLSLNKTYAASFFHDVVGEYKFSKKLSLGSGLTGWSALSRYSSPSIASSLTLDAPLYQQTTNGVNDQFLRKLSVYAKGKLGKLDYRVAVSKPFDVLNAPNAPGAISTYHSNFSLRPSQPQYEGYLMYQFWDQEDNTIPYMTGTYLGTKNVFNIGGGFMWQPQAMWQLGSVNKDTITNPLMCFNVDLFLDHPINAERGDAITLYASYSNLNFGSNYLRNSGVMNPANSVIKAESTFNGAGDAFTMYGTGNVYYLQLGYLLPKNTILKGENRLQPYAAVQYAAYQRLNIPMTMFEAGFNVYFHKANKVSFNYQLRPVYVGSYESNAPITYYTNRGMFVVQYQISI